MRAGVWLLVIGVAGCPAATQSTTDPGGPGGGGTTGDPGIDPPTCSEDELSEMYAQYIEPFVSGAVPSSCSSCHMTGIDIGLYAQDTPCQTLACMVDLGVVDLEDPASSEILAQILLGDSESSVFSVSDEYDAMLEWIEWNATCHDQSCGDIEDACTSGTGALSTGQTPIGDCSEDDLLGVFWDSVIIDRGRCLICHSDYGQEQGTFGPCSIDDDCEFEQVCVEEQCLSPGPYFAPHFFEGSDGTLDWNDEADRQLGLNTMYNVLALGLIDTESPLDSAMLTKPLLEDFQPLGILGPGVDRPTVAAGQGIGVAHGGTSKFNFGCHEPPCPADGVVDCSTQVRCGDVPCADGTECMDGFCRTTGSYCDATYVNYVRFADYYAECSNR